MRANFLSKFVGYMLVVGCVLNPYSVKIGEVSANRADRGRVNTCFLATVLALMKALAVQRRSGKEFLTLSQPKVSDAFGNHDFSFLQK